MNHVDLLHRGIAAAVQRFHRNRFDFLSERDLQALLFGILVAEFGSETIPMKGGYHSAEAYGGTDTIQTIPVKCEYSISQRTSPLHPSRRLSSLAARSVRTRKTALRPMLLRLHYGGSSQPNEAAAGRRPQTGHT